MEEILIPFSKKKLRLILCVALAFVAAGIFCTTLQDSLYFSDFNLTVTYKQLGYFFISFFSIAAIILVYKMWDKSPKLIIDKLGITDKTGNTEIFWRDITKLSVFTTHGQRMLMIHVTNPQEYIDRQTKTINRKSMWVNYKMHGTPLSINTNTLDISTDELIKIINERCNFPAAAL
ncbi:STM3941 family protein [Ferruginibacter sp. SUN106]|uniref:STM3941 family protein n=1 Tax=Ferruginibacter sp. SUN106 TaxID=2978348 RepID=UPI003D363106